MAYDWPGNVRELLNTLERALTVARNEPDVIPKTSAGSHQDSPGRGRPGAQTTQTNHIQAAEQVDSTPPPFREYRQTEIARLEKDYLRNLLDHTGGDIPRACRVSGISKSRLYALMQRYEKSPPRSG